MPNKSDPVPAIAGYDLCEPVAKMAAIVLAAGCSSRMGQFKPLLPIGGCMAVETVVRLFLSSGISDVCVVIGYKAEELRPVAEAAGARCVLNPNFERGMYSSVCAGVAALRKDTDACFIIPVDIPLVRVSTVRRLARFYAEKKRDIVFPVFEGRRGHPPLISAAVLKNALTAGPDARLSALLALHEDGACDLFVPDEGIHLDMDTPDELAGIRELALHREIPSLRECEAMLAEHQTDERVVRHSRMVADVGYRIAAAIATRHFHVEPDLARAGGLLHDLAKGVPDHATAGAQILRDFEFESVADVIAAHTDFSFAEENLDESAIVYLADKLVSGERVVGLAKRFHRSTERFQENPVALAAASRRRAVAEAIARKIESLLGCELHLVIQELTAMDRLT